MNIQNVKFIRGQAEHLEFLEDSSFSHALFCSSFHWVEDKPAALAEVYRVLRPGGIIGMTTLNREKDLFGHEILNGILQRYGLPQSRHGHGGMNRVTVDELMSLLLTAGFNDIRIDKKKISEFYHSPPAILDRPGNGSFRDIVKNLDESLKNEILDAFVREYNLRAEIGISRPGTLFAMAKKGEQGPVDCR